MQFILLLGYRNWSSFLFQGILCILRFHFFLLLQAFSCIFNFGLDCVQSEFLFVLFGFSFFVQHVFPLDGLLQVGFRITFAWLYLQRELQLVSWVLSIGVGCIFVLKLLRWDNRSCAWYSFRCLFIKTKCILFQKTRRSRRWSPLLLVWVLRVPLLL